MTNRSVTAIIALLAITTAVHYGMNFNAYTTPHAVVMPFLYVISLGCLYRIGRITRDFSYLVIYAGILFFKIAFLTFRGDENKIWEFTTAMHSLALHDIRLYYFLHDTAALVLVLVIGLATAKRTQ